MKPVLLVDDSPTVLSDYHMPGMQGVDLIGKLRRIASPRFTPMLVLTTDSQPEKRGAASRRGDRLARRADGRERATAGREATGAARVIRGGGRTRTFDPSQPGSGLSSSEHPALPASWSDAIRIAAALFGCAVLAAAEVWLRTWLPVSLGPLLALLATGAGILMGGRLAEWKRASRVTAADDDRGPGATRGDGAASEPCILPLGLVGNAEIDSATQVLPTIPALNPGVERAIGELRSYPAFTDILNRQMLSVTELSETTAASILKNLTGVDVQITALLNYLRQSGSNEQVAKVVTMIESQMQGCRELLDQFAERQLGDARLGFEQRSKIGEETASVLTAVEGVNGIARQTMILSFNASIEAARAGDAGRGFSIIATEIRKLASEAQKLSTDIRTRIEGLMGMVTVDPQEQANRRERLERDAIDKISETLSALTDNLMTLIANQRHILQKVESESESIARPILDIMGSIQFQDIIRRQLEQLGLMAETVGDHIQAIDVMLEERRDDMDEETLSQKLDNMFSNHVMVGQREPQRAAHGRAESLRAGSLIEIL